MEKQKYGFRSLRFKLALTSTLVEIVMLAILISNSAAIATQALEDQTRYRVQEIIPLLNASLASPLVERDFATLDEIIGQVVRKGGIEYLGVSDEDMRIIAEVGEKPPAYHATKSQMGLDDIAAYQHLDVPITLAGHTVGKLHLSVNTSFLDSTITTLQHEGMLIASGEVIITFVLLVLVGVLLTRNLAILASAARTMTSGDLAVRAKIESKDEIGATAKAFNTMASRLEESYNSLKHSEQRYQTLTEVSPVGIFNTDAEGRCIYVNQRYCDITGFPQERFFGTGWVDTVHADDRDQVMREWDNCAVVGMPYVGEYRIVSAEGKVVWVYAQAVKTDSAKGGYVGTVTDITRLKEVEQELARHSDSLEELVRERTTELEAAQERLLRQERLATLGQLTATVSHELRNPLGVISNAAYYLKRKCSNNKQQLDEDKVAQYLDMIQREVTAADQIIADLLSTSRTKAPVVQWIDLDELVEAIVTTSMFPEHIQWQYYREPKPFMLRADPVQLTQVLRNLLGNAIQAIGDADDGRIVLSATTTAEYYQLSFRDNGPGINEEIQDKMFEPLYTTKAKGNGLGLSISRELVRGHGGELSYVNSASETTIDNNKGAEFLLILPRENSEKEF